MEFGERLARARVAAGLTQEDVAEVLGISCQTLSSWENGKTVPNIGAVLRLSDTYGVALDDLLLPSYVAQISAREEAYRKQRLTEKGLVIGIFVAVWLFCFVFLSRVSNASLIAYVILLLRLLYRAVTAVLSFFVGFRDHWGGWKWVVPLVSAVSGCLLVLFTVRGLLFAFFLWPSLIGLLVGCRVRHLIRGKG